MIVTQFVAVLVLMAGVSAASASRAQEAPKRLELSSIALGEKAADIPDKFVEYACGTNGGPPSLPLTNFTQFAKCRPEASGLHEVYFRYDDELEYWARALELQNEINIYQGTQMYDFPVVVSLLFDDAGVVQGERVVTDDRHTEIRSRIDFWTLGNFLQQQYGSADWTCQDLPKSDGETNVGSYFVKKRCTATLAAAKTIPGAHLLLLQNYYREAGETAIDPNTGEINTDAYTSSTYFEMISDAYAAKAGL